MQRFFFFRLKTRIPVTTMLITKWIAIKEKKMRRKPRTKKQNKKNHEDIHPSIV